MILNDCSTVTYGDNLMLSVESACNDANGIFSSTPALTAECGQDHYMYTNYPWCIGFVSSIIMVFTWYSYINKSTDITFINVDVKGINKWRNLFTKVRPFIIKSRVDFFSMSYILLPLIR